ncbi:MAG TPA: type II toxin-antitoxin system RelE/ParE family toxin [Rhizomicrobium sp.]|nr:type II toxin-antitoxin system RelE/ParE family toxin [Rhizomicrobium sp.]
MTVVFTEGARADLDDILAYTKANHPFQLARLEQRIREVIALTERFPRNARKLSQRSGVRVMPLIRYPFRIFYREIETGVEILHIHHVARRIPKP